MAKRNYHIIDTIKFKFYLYIYLVVKPIMSDGENVMVHLKVNF